MTDKKKEKQGQVDDAQQFMQRMQRNLNYFQKNYPQVYKLLSSIDLKNVELVVTPGKNDVDMVAFGKSCYRGLAKEFSVDEAAKVLKENPESKQIRTFAPPDAGRYRKRNFADQLLQKIVLASPLTDRHFSGYIRGNFFPSLVFLGAGLGYHIDWLSRQAEIVNGIIIEREPEKFAVSLYTVDWHAIGSRFSRRGRSLTFAVGKAETLEEIRGLVAHYMTKDVPFYPFFSTYYNHLADVDVARGVLETAKDLSVVSANWLDYDNELVRLKNTLHNYESGARYIAKAPNREIEKPVVIVGSGPSIDQRISDLKKIRDKVTVISAGTGLRGLLAEGIIPDFQMELDPGHIVYQFHSEIDRELLKKITLLAVNEVNPKVPGLFKEVIYFLKFDNAFPYLMGLEKSGFSGCHPTVTNAALAIAHSLGVSEIYLFGTDYGFESEERDHSDHSVYGRKSDAEVSQKMREWNAKNGGGKKVFQVPSVSGGTVLTRPGYYAAKRAIEDFVHLLSQEGASLSIFNCAEGAAIAGVEWLPSEKLLSRFENAGDGQGQAGFDRELIGDLLELIPAGAVAQVMPEVHRELARMAGDFERRLKTARLNGRKDLCGLVNELRQDTADIRPIGGKPVSRAQVYAHQLLAGSAKHFLYVGLCHGMACENKELSRFLKLWRESFQTFLVELPRHFERVVFSELPVEEDPWTERTLFNADPEFSGVMPSEERWAQQAR